MFQPRPSAKRAAGSSASRKAGTTNRPAGTNRQGAKHRVTKRNAPGSTQLVGLAAALAAATAAVTFGHHAGASAEPANSTVDLAALNAARGDGPLPALATARIQRRELATRDTSRVQLAQNETRKKQAAAGRLVAARTAKLDASRAQVARRATALAASKDAVLRAQAKAAAEAKVKAQAEAKARAAAAAAEMPLSGYRITATFGQGGSRWARNHTGTDFAAPTGTRIGAVMKGVVTSAGWDGAYGQQVRVRHSDGTETWYNHMSQISVAVGDAVNAGGKVGEVGSTGNSSGPHLHLEVRPGGGEPINPMPWLRARGLNP